MATTPPVAAAAAVAVALVAAAAVAVICCSVGRGPKDLRPRDSHRGAAARKGRARFRGPLGLQRGK